MKDILKQPAQIWLQGGKGAGVATLTGSRTLNGDSAHFQILAASGSDQNVILPALGASGNGQWYIIRNSGSTYNIVVKKADGSTTVATVPPGGYVYLVSATVSGTMDWYTVHSYLGALVATAFSGRVTTTDGVTSGDARVVGGNVYTKQAGTDVNNTTTETTIGTYTVPANTVKAGTQVRIRGSLRVIGVNGTPTITLRLKLGGTTYIASAALSVIADDVVGFDVVATGRAAPGASASVAIEGTVSASQSGTPVTVQKVVAPANYATNGALAAIATIQWSAAHSANQLTCDSYSVDVVG